jgi:hypothetical protein
VTWQRGLAFAVAAVIALTGVASTVFWARLPSRLPTDDDYRRVNELLSSQKQDGDVVVIAPSWADRGRQFITALPVYAGYDLLRDEYRGSRRQWLVAVANVPRFSLDEARSTLLSRGASAAAGQHIGGLYVEPFAIVGPKVAYSFMDHLDEAEVQLGGDRPEPCRREPNGKHQCSRGGWNKVQAGWYEVQERPVHCVWAHPVGEQPVEIAFHNVAVPPGSKITGWAAFVGQAAAAEGAAPVHLDAVVDGQAAPRAEFPNEFGKQPFEKPLPGGTPTSTVTLRVTTPNPGMRHFCFDAWVQPPG